MNEGPVSGSCFESSNVGFVGGAAIAEATLNGSYPVAVIQILMACACPVIDVIRLILLFTLER